MTIFAGKSAPPWPVRLCLSLLRFVDILEPTEGRSGGGRRGSHAVIEHPAPSSWELKSTSMRLAARRLQRFGESQFVLLFGSGRLEIDDREQIVLSLQLLNAQLCIDGRRFYATMPEIFLKFIQFHTAVEHYRRICVSCDMKAEIFRNSCGRCPDFQDPVDRCIPWDGEEEAVGWATRRKELKGGCIEWKELDATCFLCPEVQSVVADVLPCKCDHIGVSQSRCTSEKECASDIGMSARGLGKQLDFFHCQKFPLRALHSDPIHVGTWILPDEVFLLSVVEKRVEMCHVSLRRIRREVGLLEQIHFEGINPRRIHIGEPETQWSAEILEVFPERSPGHILLYGDHLIDVRHKSDTVTIVATNASAAGIEVYLPLRDAELRLLQDSLVSLFRAGVRAGIEVEFESLPVSFPADRIADVQPGPSGVKQPFLDVTCNGFFPAHGAPPGVIQNLNSVFRGPNRGPTLRKKLPESAKKVKRPFQKYAKKGGIMMNMPPVTQRKVAANYSTTELLPRLLLFVFQ